MRRFVLPRLLTVLALSASSAAAQPAAQQAAAIDPRVALSDSAIRAVIKDRVDTKRSSGIAVGILDPDGRTRVFAYGASGTSRPLDGQSVFEIGSITKTFTATTLADMVAKGEVKLDDPVAKYLPASAHVPSRNGREITLVDLATQSSGLPRMPSNFAPKDQTNPYADYTEQQAVDFVSSYQLPRDVGAKYEYSNLGMGLLGIALTRREGVSYEALVRKHVIDPLGMNDTRVTFTPSMRERLALGHDESGAVVSNWDIPGLAGAGALRSTVNDMLRYLQANVDPSHTTLAPAIDMAHAKRYATDNPQKQGGASTSETVKSGAIGAAAGAVLGAMLSGGDRDKILLGAGLGAVAGTAISLGRSGENGVLPAGSRLSVQTTQDIALR